MAVMVVDTEMLGVAVVDVAMIGLSTLMEKTILPCNNRQISN
jgi:hypothetical protein